MNKFWIFLLCAGIVFFIQFIILQPVIQYRLFDTQDWMYLNIYKSFKFLDSNPFSQLINSWINIGLHEASQIYYIGILSKIFGFNYQAYQVANILLKTAATLSFFPLILIIFKNKLLAFLSTLLFGINSATAGSLQIIALGEEFLAVTSLNIFLITYYCAIFKKTKMLYFLSSLFFLLTFLMAPPRMFPLLVLIPLIEVYWLFKNQKIKNLKFSVMRVLLHLFPVILIFLSTPVSSSGFQFTNHPFILLKDIIGGNWHNLLDPFAGIGWMLLTNDFWKFFGRLELGTFKNFGEYLTFLFSGPLLIFGSLTLILSLVLSKKPMKFFLLVFSINFVAEILMFFIANDNYRIFESILKTDYLGRFIIISDPNILALDDPIHFIFTKYPTILGIYILIVAFVAFLEWRKNKENRLLQAMWVGPVFSVIFHFPGWIIQGFLINDFNSIHRYFLVPAMGMTVALAAILVLIYEKLKQGKFSRVFAMLVILSVTLVFYQSHKEAIAKEYLGMNPERVSFKDQQKLHEELITNLGNSAKTGDILVYMEIAEDLVNLRRTPQFYKVALVETDFADWLHFRRSEVPGCIEAIFDKNILRSAIQLRDNELGFVYKGMCLEEDDNIKKVTRVNKVDHFYKTDNFYAIRVKGGQFINIKDEILRELRLFNP